MPCRAVAQSLWALAGGALEGLNGSDVRATSSPTTRNLWRPSAAGGLSTRRWSAGVRLLEPGLRPGRYSPLVGLQVHRLTIDPDLAIRMVVERTLGGTSRR